MLRVGAFFDLDRTLVACNTGGLFLKDLRARGEISFWKGLQALGWMAKYHLSLIDLERVAEKILVTLKDRSEAEFAERCRLWTETEVLPRLLPSGLRKIEEHRQQGHVLALLSTSPSYVTSRVAEALGLEAALGTRFEVRDGQFTGRLDGPACFGRGKIHWAEDLGRRKEVALEQSWFYTDSFSDMPMLERVGNRVVVNPNPRLRRAARARGWPVEQWAEARSSR